jgi:hypothetical protein
MADMMADQLAAASHLQVFMIHAMQQIINTLYIPSQSTMNVVITVRKVRVTHTDMR